MAKNTNLNAAKLKKNDEFYTQLEDIYRELSDYKEHFRGKVVYCNCDDPKVSNFFRYFVENFEHLGLKKLITTCYKSKTWDMFSQNDSEQAVRLEYNGDKDGNRQLDPEEIDRFPLNGDGDFRSPECIDLLKQADIVVTNPPFSLFRQYVAQLIEYDKKFVIVGNPNAVTYKEIFPFIKDDKMWIGNKSMGTDMLFDITEEYAQELVEKKKEGSAYKIIDGVIKGRTQAIWFTNLQITKRRKELTLYKEYMPGKYPKYDNYDAIEVCPVKEIPVNYGGAMGVPITFLDKYNPDQFEILGVAYLWDDSVKTHKYYDDFVEVRPDGSKTGMSGKKANGLAVLPGRKKGKNSLVRGDEVVRTAYKRIFIRNKHPQP